MQTFWKYFLTIIAIAFIYGCADQIVESTSSIDEENEVVIDAPKFSEIQTNIFNQSCAFSGCHSTGSVSPDLSGNAYSNIVNRPSSTGKDYVEPNDLNDSYLLQKVLGANGINGSRMPLSASPLSQSQIDALKNWISDGAQNN